MPNASKTTRRGPVDDLWRVDVRGFALKVKGGEAARHLEQTLHQMARMQMALHKISQRHPNEGTTGDSAREALKNV